MDQQENSFKAFGQKSTNFIHYRGTLHHLEIITANSGALRQI